MQFAEAQFERHAAVDRVELTIDDLRHQTYAGNGIELHKPGGIGRLEERIDRAAHHAERVERCVACHLAPLIGRAVLSRVPAGLAGGGIEGQYEPMLARRRPERSRDRIGRRGTEISHLRPSSG
jgi:hypothetical protein